MACRAAAAVIAALAPLATGGCTQDLCARNSDCETGLVCSQFGNCIVPPPPCNAGGDGDAGTDGGTCASDAGLDAADAPFDSLSFDAGGDATQFDASTIAIACPAALLPCWPALIRGAAPP